MNITLFSDPKREFKKNDRAYFHYQVETEEMTTDFISDFPMSLHKGNTKMMAGIAIEHYKKTHRLRNASFRLLKIVFRDKEGKDLFVKDFSDETLWQVYEKGKYIGTVDRKEGAYA